MLFKFLGQIFKKDSSENLIFTGRIEERKITRKQRTICLMHLDEWIVDLGQEKMIKTVKHRLELQQTRRCGEPESPTSCRKAANNDDDSLSIIIQHSFSSNRKQK